MGFRDKNLEQFALAGPQSGVEAALSGPQGSASKDKLGEPLVIELLSKTGDSLGLIDPEKDRVVPVVFPDLIGQAFVDLNLVGGATRQAVLGVLEQGTQSTSSSPNPSARKWFGHPSF